MKSIDFKLTVTLDDDIKSHELYALAENIANALIHTEEFEQGICPTTLTKSVEINHILNVSIKKEIGA